MDPLDLLKAFRKGRKSKPSGKDLGLPKPVLQKHHDDLPLIDLPPADSQFIFKKDVHGCLKHRQSRRNFSDKPLSIYQLSYILWATQGVREAGPSYTKRTVPGSGSVHPFETYLILMNVSGLQQGLYRYLPLSHQLVFMRDHSEFGDRLLPGLMNQEFCQKAAAVFAWAAIPERMSWKYGDRFLKAILLDAGHVGQNFYLSSEALGLAACGIGAYQQDLIDSLLGLDGKTELTVYMGVVGNY